jgi:non-canonical purine NTP pyrophosphatase (RdgB/HAM1 family)
MKEGNPYKLKDAQEKLANYDIAVIGISNLEIPEIQSVEGEKIATDKADYAYKKLNEPLIVNDTIWLVGDIPGFPGPYMKHINATFSVNDWLKLMQGRKNRKVTMREIIVYRDRDICEVFFKDVVGEFLEKPSGVDGVSSDKIISFDGIQTIAAARDKGKVTVNSGENSYDLFGRWFIGR